MLTDPIADMLTRIRNASMAHKKETAMPFSKLKLAIAEILVREGYVLKAVVSEENPKNLVVVLKYNHGAPAIQSIVRLSTPGHRRYVKKSEIKAVLNGYGLSILSTPAGIKTNKEAIKENVGGELLCEVY